MKALIFGLAVSLWVIVALGVNLGETLEKNETLREERLITMHEQNQLEIENKELRYQLKAPKIEHLDLSKTYEVKGEERFVLKTKDGYFLLGFLDGTLHGTNMDVVQTEKEVLDYMNSNGYKVKE